MNNVEFIDLLQGGRTPWGIPWVSELREEGVKEDLLKNLGLGNLDIVKRNGTLLCLGQPGSWDNSVIWIC